MKERVYQLSHYSWHVDHGSWFVKTEHSFICTKKHNDKYTARFATDIAVRGKDVVCFKIKVWGRAGWNS